MKKRLLCWSDSAIAGTGFGVVSKHILTALSQVYDIHHLAINHHGEFHDQDKFPWQMQPAKLLDPKDLHGIKMFHRTLLMNTYDLVWIMNDLDVTSRVVDIIDNVRNHYRSQSKNPPIFIHYYPVDCHVLDNYKPILQTLDFPVCYTTHGSNETLKTIPEINNKLQQIPHGVDNTVFYPAFEEECKAWKKNVLKVPEDAYVVINANRNSSRKQIPYSMLAFKEFKKHVPNAVMYLHTAIADQGGRLDVAIKDLGMGPRDYILPHGYGPANPVPEEVLNQLYNCADMFLSTHLGEGWGLTITESMAAGTPVVCPNNTCMPQQLGDNSERGYLYECEDMTWIDDSGFRPKGLMPTIVNKMLECYNDGPKWKNKKVELAKQYAIDHDWNTIGCVWIDLFKQIEEQQNNSQNDLIMETL